MRALLAVAGAIGALLLIWVGGASGRAQATKLTLKVISARTEPRAFGGDGVEKGAVIADYKFILNVDNTGTSRPNSGCAATDPGYPDHCAWQSINEPSGSDPSRSTAWAPIYAQGDQGDLAALGALPNGRYLISVLADGYKIDGAHFCVGAAPGCETQLSTSTPLLVELQPNPLPDGTLRALVFQDNAPTNMGYDTGEALLSGFRGEVVDSLGPIQTDVYGNPLCTTYVGEDPDTHQIPLSALDDDMLPVVAHPGGSCLSDADGILTIPHLGSNRYAVSVIPPDGTGPWIQTTTLEGNHDYDAWIMEGDTGYSTIFARGGEPTPDPIFGFVKPTNTFAAGGTGHITGAVVGIKTYTPPKGGFFDFWGGNTGTKVGHPIDRPWLALADLDAGDVAVWVGRGDEHGAFDISGVPDGNYMLSWWDEPQDYNLNVINVTVSHGETVQMGQLPLNGWWTEYEGYVFDDANRNGRMDPGERGIPNFTLTLRHRENNLMDRGQSTATTDFTGHYYFESGYPTGEWNVLEAYSDSFYTTGVTYQADNQPTPTTIKGAGVDVSALPIIGLSGRIDWGVHAYDPTGTNGVDPRNGGIVGTVSYDTTRNELDPRYAATEDWQPGISGVPVELYAPVDCADPDTQPCDADGRYQLAADGSYARGALLNTYVSESWSRPTGCTARDVDGNPLVHDVDENALVPTQETTGECISSFMQGIQFGPYATDQGSSDANFGAAVNGNYGFGDGCFDGTLDATDPESPVCVGGDFETLPAGDYLVHVAIPDDATGNPMYKVTGEEDINIGNGDQIVPQVPPPACAGALHTVNLLGDGEDAYPAVVGDGGVTNDLPVGVTVPASTLADAVDNATFLDIGGSPYEGEPRPRCDTKLVELNNGKSIVPIFNLFTDVPVPSRLRAVIIDDLRFSTDPRSIMYGEKAGLAFAPVGIYDFNNKLEYTTETDFNGIYDVLMPSTNHISCPTPSGVCANMYRFVANDPGIPGRLNLNYNAAFATHAAGAEAVPGASAFADLAPTQVGLTIERAGTGTSQAVDCSLSAATPQLLAVSRPYVTDDERTFTIKGTGFGDSKGSGGVTLDGVALQTTSWSNTQIGVTVPGTIVAGPHQLEISAGNGQHTVNGLTFHVLGFGAFPSTQVLDNFNRTGIGSNWTADSVFSLSSNSVRVTGTGTMRWGGSAGGGPSYGANQEAYFTFVKVSPTATEQGLFLKITGNGNNPNPTSNPGAYVEVSYKATSPTSVQVRTKASGTNTVVLQATFPATFVAGNVLGARALADGTVIAYKGGTEIGRVNVTSTTTPWPSGNAAGGGRLGVRFVGAQNNTTNDARFDNFGGGTLSGGYSPNLYEVGPDLASAPNHFAVIQDALDAARLSAGDDLVVVYPGAPDLANPRNNPRGSYYENLIMASPVKLQGVGPGGFQGNTFVPGSIIDASAFGGDTAAATAWYDKIATLTWDGNQGVNDAQAIYVLASQNAPSQAQVNGGRARQFTTGFKASIDGFDIRGGIQNGFPGNINDLTGGATGLPPTIETQGGAIFANAYARNLQITNNVVQNNGGSYGTIRIGTPDLAAPDTNQHNEGVRIANNRVIKNAGTNLAGGIGLFAGADDYEVASNDICGNFSLEYGGGLSVYGRSPNGKIHHNRIYFNMSNDEGGGIMIAGALPLTPGALSPGSGPVDIYANQIQANLANDDGGGLRFLMAGNSPMNVYNNFVVNNVSTHEGGGIALDDAPNVRVFNNTIMKNLTTATAVTSNGQPAPAGLSTSANSDQLQRTLPTGSPSFSNPLLFNNIFWDNRAGTRAGTTVTGIGLAGDATPIDHWDVGVADGTGQLAPTSSIVQQLTGQHPYTTSGTNSAANPNVVDEYDVSVSFATWRQNPAFVDATLVTVELPPNLLGNYRLKAGSPALNLGAASKAVPTYQRPPTSLAAPTTDVDDESRPFGGGVDAGADERH